MFSWIYILLSFWCLILVLVLLGYFMAISCCVLILSSSCWFYKKIWMFLNFFHVHKRTSTHAWIVFQSCSLSLFLSCFELGYQTWKYHKTHHDQLLHHADRPYCDKKFDERKENRVLLAQCNVTALKGKKESNCVKLL